MPSNMDLTTTAIQWGLSVPMVEMGCRGGGGETKTDTTHIIGWKMCKLFTIADERALEGVG